MAFQNGEVPLEDGAEIRKHLAVCEFCAAEVEFYESYPPNAEQDEAIEADSMPTPLFELAEALLIKKRDDDFFDRLMDDEYKR